MMSHQFKFFVSVICCCVIQAIHGGGPPPNWSNPLVLSGRSQFQPGSFKPLPSTFYSSLPSSVGKPPAPPLPPARPGIPFLKFNGSYGSSASFGSASSPGSDLSSTSPVKDSIGADKSETSAVPPPAPLPGLKFTSSLSSTSKPEIPDSSADSSTVTSEESSKTKNSSRGKNKSSKSPRRSNSKSRDPAAIPNREVLKERAKEVIRDLIVDLNANRALTRIVLNGRTILEDKVGSDIIIRHMHLIKETLTNEEAKVIFNEGRINIATSLTEKQAPMLTRYIFHTMGEYFADPKLPQLYKENFSNFHEMIRCPHTQNSLRNLTNEIIKFFSSRGSHLKIDNMFETLENVLFIDFGKALKIMG